MPVAMTSHILPFAGKAPFVLIAVAFAWSQPALADTRSFGITSYDRVEVNGDMIVEIVPDHRITAVAEGSRAALETLSIDVNGDRTLVIRQVAEGAFGPRTRGNTGPIRIRLTSQNLAGVVLRGAGEVRAGQLRGRNIVVQNDGAGRVQAAIADGDAVRLANFGSGSIIVTGRARALNVNVEGAGGIDASGMTALFLTLRAVGTGASRFTASEQATVRVGGAPTIDVSGRARCTVDNSGAGTVRCENRTR
jgi:hypothetical protein